MEQRAKLLVTIDSRFDCIPHVGKAVESLCSLFPLSQKQVYEVQLCVVEAVSNAIKHAYHNEPGHHVEVQFEISCDKVSIRVCDLGTTMDQSFLEETSTFHLQTELADPQAIPESGRGLFIMKTLMDEIVYTSKGGKNCLTLTKTLLSQPKIP